MSDYRLIIESDKTYEIVPENKVILEIFKKSYPSKLTFSLYDFGFLPEVGDTVSFFVGEKGIFKGKVFNLSVDGSSKRVTVSCFDSLRYLKNKDNYVYQNKKASDVVKMIAGDFSLPVSEISDTGYIIPYRIEEQKTLFDIIENALAITFQNTGEKFVLYDNFEGLTLVKENALQSNLLIDEGSFENYAFTTSIEESYNKVKLLHEVGSKKKREIFIARDNSLEEKYGSLQYFSRINGDENGNTASEKLLEELKNPKKTFSLSGVFGDVNVRAGSKIHLDIGGFKGEMTVLKVTHYFYHSLHLMDLTLEGF